jgi:hypothetical protein
VGRGGNSTQADRTLPSQHPDLISSTGMMPKVSVEGQQGASTGSCPGHGCAGGPRSSSSRPALLQGNHR